MTAKILPLAAFMVLGGMTSIDWPLAAAAITRKPFPEGGSPQS